MTRPASASDPFLVLAQAGVLHELQRGGAHARRDVRVAVAVAADPGAEAQQRRHRDVVVGVRRADRRLEVAVELGDDGGERRGEVDEPGLDLVEHGRRHRAQLVGDPHLLHGGGDLTTQLVLLDARRPVLVELAQQGEDAGELVDRRAPPRLGRVRGEDEAHLGGGERVAQLLGGRAVGGELGDGGVQRAAARAGSLVEALDAAHAVEVLGEVHEQKPPREHADEQDDVGEVEVLDQLGELVRGGGVATARARAEVDGAAVQHERLRSLDGADHLVEDAAEQLLVVGVRAAGGVHEGDGVHVAVESTSAPCGRLTDL